MSPVSFVLVCILVFGVSSLLIFFLTRVVARVAGPGDAVWVLPVALVAWFIAANIVGYTIGGDLISIRGAIAQVLPQAGGILLIFLSKTMGRWLAKMSPEKLISLQVYRATGILFFYLYFHDHFVSRGFALSAGTGDLIIGATALFVARGAGKGYIWIAVLWNILGLIDLVAAPIAAAIDGFQGIVSYPLVLVPLFLGPPMGTLLHFGSLRNLRLRARPQGAR